MLGSGPGHGTFGKQQCNFQLGFVLSYPKEHAEKLTSYDMMYYLAPGVPVVGVQAKREREGSSQVSARGGVD